jgi:hypothetical protein
MKVHAVGAISTSGPPTNGNRLVSLCGEHVHGLYVRERTEISLKLLCDACKGALVERAKQTPKDRYGRRGPQRVSAPEEPLASEPRLSATG